MFDCTALEVCDFHTGDVLNVNANANISLQFVITSSGIVTIREMAWKLVGWFFGAQFTEKSNDVKILKYGQTFV